MHRPYLPEDEAACLALFASNMPDLFAPEERLEFAEFLKTMNDPYFVVEDGEQLVACGGVFLRSDGRTAGLSWGMVERSKHRRGYGRVLLQIRLDWLRMHAPEVEAITIDTSQHSAPFFAHMGFETQAVEPDYYAPGLDRHVMQLLLVRSGS
ncbi:N-acetyltransferase [Deinococcus seoulensis]|uniref:N-acetyltransferase n=1 Tax=Deinococcus seoulensis TaxID=1837379 RepID=A0ABQ2RY85_9DEIO|nr:GNAT family N-acetyltransferase [Deinococcus seoulensis]GGR68343.1 N-acetyltransferase [Deinococcus seoulensis]